jgi:hypothetical protein
MNKTYRLLLVLLAFGFLAGCGPKEQLLSGDERDAVLAFSETKTDNLLEGMNANDYQVFSKDFDQDMLSAMTPEQFGSMKRDRDEKLGLYISRKVDRVVQIGDFYAVIYDSVFEKDDAVSVRVVFRTAELHEISGLWFDK